MKRYLSLLCLLVACDQQAAIGERVDTGSVGEHADGGTSRDADITTGPDGGSTDGGTSLDADTRTDPDGGSTDGGFDANTTTHPDGGSMCTGDAPTCGYWCGTIPWLGTCRNGEWVCVGTGAPTCPDAGVDAHVGNDGGLPELPVAIGDFSCVGTRTAPAPGPIGSFTAHVYDFQMPSSMVPNLNLEIFPNNIVSHDCTGACQSLTTNASGGAIAMGASGGWFAYRTAPNATQVLTVGYHRVTPSAGGTANLASVSATTVGLIPTLFGRMRLPGTAIVSGSIVDCRGRPVENSIVRFFQGDTELVPGTGRTDYFTGYFMGPVPAPSRTATSSDGRFAAANAIPSSEPVFATVWARTEAGGDVRMIACEELQIFADGVSIISMGPLRNDYPLGSGCPRVGR